VTAESIGKRIERLAAAKGITMAEVREHLDVSYETTRKWATGDTAPRRAHTAKLAALLEVSQNAITYGDTALTPREQRLLMTYRRLERRLETLPEADRLDELMADLASAADADLVNAVRAAAGRVSAALRKDATRAGDFSPKTAPRPGPQTAPKRSPAPTSRRSGASSLPEKPAKR